MSCRILVVDDEDEIRTKLSELLEIQGYDVQASANGADALQVVERDPSAVDIVLTDFKMPGMNGIELAERISQIDSKIIILLITAYSDKETAIAAMRTGVSDFLDKPFTIRDLSFALHKATDRRNILVENERYRLNLERMVWERTQELQKAFREIKATYRQTLQSLGAALDTRDVETLIHSRRVAGYTVTLSFKLGCLAIRSSTSSAAPTSTTSEDRSAGRHLPEAGTADTGGMGDHALARRARLPDDREDRVPEGRVRDGLQPPREVRRNRISAGAERRRHTDRGEDLLCGGHV